MNDRYIAAFSMLNLPLARKLPKNKNTVIIVNAIVVNINGFIRSTSPE
jgi:hypothetical protein